MPKQTTLTPVAALEDEIERLKSEIKDKLAQIENQEHHNREFEQSLKLLSAGAGQFIPEGQLAPLDALNQLLMDADSQKEREAKWSLANAALQKGREALTVLRGQIQLLRQELAGAQIELDWESNYAPHAEKYRNGFPLPSPEQKQQRQIAELQAQINEKKRRLKIAEDWERAPKERKPIYYGLVPGSLPEQDINVLTGTITTLEKNIDSLRNSEPRRDPDYELAFRVYVRSRVAIEAPLNRLLAAQCEYLSAVIEFQEALSKHPGAAEFGASSLKPQTVHLDNGKVVLSNG